MRADVRSDSNGATLYLFKCDRCGMQSAPATSVRNARWRARACGWLIIDSKHKREHLCPKCKEKEQC